MDELKVKVIDAIGSTRQASAGDVLLAAKRAFDSIREAAIAVGDAASMYRRRQAALYNKDK